MKIRLSITLTALVFLLGSCSDDHVTNPRKYRLTTSVDPVEAGTINPAQGEYEEGEMVQLTATPNQHWVFSRWEGDHTGTGSTASVRMDRDKNISALFTKREYPLTIEIEGEGTVGETVVQQKTTDYAGGTTVELTAVASEGWRFDHWEGDVEGTDNPVIIEIMGEKMVTAFFERKDYPLTVNVVGDGTVSEEVVQAKTTNYPYQTLVQLTAIPAEGWVFSGWNGDLTGSENPAQITVEDASEVTAEFVKDYFTINITYDGAGTASTELISGNQSAEGFEYESQVSITVEPESGWRFVGWQGDLGGADNPIEVTVTGNISAVAVLEQVPFEGGGTLDNPYLIATVEDLQMIAEPRFLGNHFKQLGNIDATATASWNNGQGFKPIGFLETKKFTGSYDGGGFQINGLAINLNITVNVTEFAVGLFGFVDHALIKNLILEDVNIVGTWGVGGLVGNASTGSRLENVHVSGNVTGSNHVGGLAGFLSNSEVYLATAQVTVQGEDQTGGLVGTSFEGRVSGSHAGGSVTGTQSVGGLIGHQESAKMVIGSYATGEVTGSINVGGLIGSSFNTSEMIRYNYATGNVTGDQNAGGLVGIFSGEAVISETYASGNVSSNNGTFIGGLVGRMTSSKIYKSFALGDVSGNNGVGGVVGRNDADVVISEIYSTGHVAGTLNVGGLIGFNAGLVNKSYWDKETSGQENPAVWDPYNAVTVATGLTTIQMTGSNAQGNMPDFDWVYTWKTSQSYPILKIFASDALE